MDREELGTIAKPSLESIGKPLEDRANRFRILEEEQRKFRPVIYWYLSFRCNLACAHCSVNSAPWVDSSEDLTTEECMDVIDQMADLNVRATLLSGGEFLIRPDALQIMRALGDKGISIGLETNGIRYPPGFTELARNLQERGLLSMTISLDGGTKETHERLRGPRSFERTITGLRLLKENGIRFNVQCVLNHVNVHTIPDLYRLAQELYPACSDVQWATLNPIGRGAGLIKEIGIQPEDIPLVFELIKKWQPVFGGATVVKVPPAVVPPKHLPLIQKGSKTTCVTTCQFPLLGVLPNGDVTICAVSRDDKELHFGNIRARSVRLKTVWERTRMEMLRSRYLAPQHLEGVCADCVWKYTCKGACRAWAYEEGGSFDAPFPICQSLHDAGAFPKVYRLSLQNAAASAKFKHMDAGCGCSSAPLEG